MIHKHIGGKNKQRNVKHSLDYLLRVKKENEQEFVKVLSQTDRKDIENFNEYIKSKNFKNPYITGVLSFEEKDIDQDLKNKIISDFEDVLFAGIEPEERPPIMWIQHKDKNRLELNYTTFNCLQNRKHYQVYYHNNDKYLFNAFCEKINYENNISSVLDVKEHKASNTLVNTLNNKIPEEKKEIINKLQEEILSKIISEELNNREELISFIKSKNIIINRIRENAISIKFSKDDKPISLKGDIYEQDRDYKTYRTESTIDHRADKQYIERQLSKYNEEYSTGIEKRTIRNRSRFKSTQNKNEENDFSRNKQANDIESVRYEIPNNNNSDNVIKYNPNTIGNVHDNEEINNEQNKRNDKTESRKEKSTEFDLPREIETAYTEQQSIYSRIEKVRGDQHKFRKSLDSNAERSGLYRKSLHGFIRLLKRFVRPAEVYSRRFEIKEKFRQKDIKKTYKAQEIKNDKRNDNRARHRPF
ncbi:TPA: hypothetical protein M8I79_005282 [Klebsiella pneumoniae]|nr:hypothetical protein [Klebsiella pneumoniae]